MAGSSGRQTRHTSPATGPVSVLASARPVSFSMTVPASLTPWLYRHTGPACWAVSLRPPPQQVAKIRVVAHLPQQQGEYTHVALAERRHCLMPGEISHGRVVEHGVGAAVRLERARGAHRCAERDRF